jgi:hypothetical protein
MIFVGAFHFLFCRENETLGIVVLVVNTPLAFKALVSTGVHSRALKVVRFDLGYRYFVALQKRIADIDLTQL